MGNADCGIEHGSCNDGKIPKSEIRIPKVAAATRHVLLDIETFSRYVLKTPLYAYQIDPALWQKKEELECLQAQDGRQRVFIVGPDQVRGCPEKALS